MTFVSDTFTDTANTALQSHTPDQGGPWVRHPNSGAVNMAITAAGTRVRVSNSGVSQVIIYYVTGSPATAEYDVTADFVLMGAPTGDSSGIAGRLSTSATTMYIARYDLANTRWQLAKIVAGSLTDLGTFTQVLTPGQTYAVKLQLRDAAKKVFVDGVERISSADNGIASAGVAGFRAFTSSTPSDAASLQWDNFSAADPVVAPPANTVAPAISTDGTPATSETITCSTGTWSNSPTGYIYQWQRDTSVAQDGSGFIDISGATSSSYLLAFADEGKGIRCRVTATNTGGSATASSNTITPAVTSPLATSDIKFRLSGGVANTSPASSYGGIESATETGDDLLDLVLYGEAAAGADEYRLVYVHNIHGVFDGSVQAWIGTQLGHGMTLAIGVATEAAGQTVAQPASSSTVPPGVTFSSPADVGSALTFTVPHGSFLGLWLRRRVPTGTSPSQNNAWQVATTVSQI